MKQPTLLSMLFTTCSFFAQEIENVDYRLEGKNIVINYDLVNCKSSDKYDITVYFNEQNGTQFNPKTIRGDVKNVSCGSKRIVWDVLQDVQDLKGKWQVSLKYTMSKTDDYKAFELKIGNQIWMTENLNVAKFRNGDPIPQAKSNDEWRRAIENKQPAWCYYNNDPANGIKYGKLYNWYAVNDSRGIAPKEYHIPSDDEWSMLKEKFASDWHLVHNGSNISVFSVFPCGYRKLDGTFNDNGYWWSSTKGSTSFVWYRRMGYGKGGFKRYGNPKRSGLSVRCIKD